MVNLSIDIFSELYSVMREISVICGMLSVSN